MSKKIILSPLNEISPCQIKTLFTYLKLAGCFLKLIKFASLARLGWMFAYISELNHDDEVTLGNVFSILKKTFLIYYEWVSLCDVIIVVCATDAL